MTVDDRIKDIQEHPERHRHTFDTLQRCCMHNGALSMAIMQAHEDYASVGRNSSGAKCDVTEGPCSCGAWH